MKVDWWELGWRIRFAYKVLRTGTRGCCCGYNGGPNGGSIWSKDLEK